MQTRVNISCNLRSPDDFFDTLRISTRPILPVKMQTYARNQQLHGVGDSGMLPNRLPTREVQMLKKPTLCIFFITRYISHSIRHPVPLILFDRSAAGDGLAIHFDLKVSPATVWTARLCPCCTWRSCARSLPSTRAHASARCSLLAHSRSPRGQRRPRRYAPRSWSSCGSLPRVPVCVLLQSLRDGLLIVTRYAHSYCNHPIKLRGVPYLDSIENVGFVQLIRPARRRHSSRNYWNGWPRWDPRTISRRTLDC